jgi:NADPH:quinone reductase-like Zn-dependent oxidoreductase
LENENVAMSQQDRTVALALLGHIELESKDDNPEVDVESKAISQMLDLTDLIIDAIDEEDFTNALDIETDTGTYVMTAQLGEWNWADSSAGVLLLFLVHVKVAYSKNL